MIDGEVDCKAASCYLLCLNFQKNITCFEKLQAVIAYFRKNVFDQVAVSFTYSRDIGADIGRELQIFFGEYLFIPDAEVLYDDIEIKTLLISCSIKV